MRTTLHSRGLRLLLAGLSLVLLAAPAAAPAKARKQHAAKPNVRLLSTPAVVGQGRTGEVRGRAAHGTTVDLQARIGSIKTLASAKVGAGGRFALKFTSPGGKLVRKVRLRARTGSKVVGYSAAWTLQTPRAALTEAGFLNLTHGAQARAHLRYAGDGQAAQLTETRLEEHVDLDAHDTETVQLHCDDGILVTDGSWRVDHVDQGTGTLASVHALENRAIDETTWQIRLRNDADGRAQAKAFATCFKIDKSEFMVTDTVSHTQTFSSGGGSTIRLACAPNQMAIQPGYSLASGSAVLSESMPTRSGWRFTFESSGPIGVTASIRCLSTRLSPDGSDAFNLRLFTTAKTVGVPSGQALETSVSCPDDAKGLVSGFKMSAGSVNLGGEPQSKIRVYDIYGAGPTTGRGLVSLQCIGDRSSAPVDIDSTPPAPPGADSSTTVVDPSAVGSVPAPGEDGTVVLDGEHPELLPGGIFAVSVGPHTPHGFLGQIVNARIQGGKTYLDVTETSLLDAAPQGDIAQVAPIPDTDSEDPQGGRRSAVNPDGTITLSRTANIRETKYGCGSSSPLEITGRVRLTAGIDVDASWSLFHGLSAHFIGSAGASAKITAEAKAGIKCEFEHELFEKGLEPIVFFVGPIPVVIEPKIGVALKAEAEAKAAVEASVEASMSYRAGLRYEHGDFIPVSEFKKGFQFTPPEDVEFTGEIKAGVVPSLQLLFYGLGGPEADLFIGLKATFSPDPLWALSIPIELTAKVVIPVLDIESPEINLFEHEFPIADSGGGTPPDQPTIGAGKIHFDEFYDPTGPDGGTVSGELGDYADLGILFDDAPGGSDTGGYGFDGDCVQDDMHGVPPAFDGKLLGEIVNSPRPYSETGTRAFRFHFVDPDSHRATTVRDVSFDLCYLNDGDKVTVEAHHPDGRTDTQTITREGQSRVLVTGTHISSIDITGVPKVHRNVWLNIDNIDWEDDEA